MVNFNFYAPTEIEFGKDAELKVGGFVKKYGKTVLLHFGKGHIKKTGLYDRILNQLSDEGISVVELGGVKANPDIELVREGIALCRDHKVDFILAVGGGSVIDSAKAIALGVPYEGDVWDFFYNGKTPLEVLPLGAVLTIPAAGSEMSKFSVITNGKYKIGYANDLMRLKFSILNPELTYSLSPWQTAAGVVDIMAHVMERYFTEETHVDFSDGMCEGLLHSMIKNGPKVLSEPDNYDTRAEVMWAGCIAHNGLLGMGRIEDWASHRIQMPLSALYDITHGAGLAIIFPAWIKYVSQLKPQPFIKFFTRVFNVPYDFDNPESVIKTGLELMENFYKSLGMPTRLKDLDIDDSRFDELAGLVTEKGPTGFLVKLDRDAVQEIYKLAL
ncbi:iron-containing alcohol dehydrogenase [Oceanispirochaeta sp.]|jgi:alcohol dehydrogenase YqhD (iron-dependent ADH family)|uniref:iron-containing alcohol dehydrogenase n=1 Tax=Oceanispirochaeta sp. TaxID=2035350 RepID=UPI00261644D3|nr:iron-containing alcohol dehydrogenase [Oceanispirochaeta sp.]MDA3955272.1 iron-containing alcohol dehydrogenase [Oceanispirochaeta sp.]